MEWLKRAYYDSVNWLQTDGKEMVEETWEYVNEHTFTVGLVALIVVIAIFALYKCCCARRRPKQVTFATWQTHYGSVPQPGFVHHPNKVAV